MRGTPQLPVVSADIPTPHPLLQMEQWVWGRIVA
jgi:hypothetical protein